MQEIGPLVSDLFVNSRDLDLLSPVSVRSLLLLTQTPLCFLELILRIPDELRMLRVVFIGGGDQIRKTNIHSGRFAVVRKCWD